MGTGMSLTQDAATLCYALYQYPDSPQVAWDYQDGGTGSDGVVWAAHRREGLLWVVLRGSVTNEDWQRDFYTFVNPFLHDDLGPIHPGFYQGLPLVRDRVLSLARPSEPLAVAGHSLGAGRTRLLTGLLCLAGRPPICCRAFGEPHSGGDKLDEIISAVSDYISLRNVGEEPCDRSDYDLVTAVPPWFNSPKFTNTVVRPLTSDPWGLFKYHHMSLYMSAAGVEGKWTG